MPKNTVAKKQYFPYDTSMITFDNVSKSYGARVLFENVTFNVGKGERVGLVGRNGHGKTTLMRIISGEETADSGKISVPKNYKIGFLKQRIAFSERTVIAEAMLGLPEEEERWKAEKILSGLGFSKADLERAPEDFSGGYQVRLTLAKVLLFNPDMLLLDEPTNYLDILSVRWLKNFLSQWKSELILITHDRQFMDDVATHTLGIHRARVRKIEGHTDKFYNQIAKDEEIYEKTRVNDEQKRKELERYISRFRAKARLANLVQSRIKTLGKMEKREKLEKIDELEFSFRYKPFAAKQIMRCDGVNFGYEEDNLLIKNFSIIVGSKDKIGVIGKNGKGKSTLLKLLSGNLKPLSGSVTMHTGSACGYFEQTNTSSLVPTRTVEEEIQSVSENLDRTQVRNICGAMLFGQDDALKKIGVLSGGEKSRVMLGKIIATPLNLIMLDEPTNHLDMDSCDGLMEAVDNFEGALIMVTHNKIFLHGLANRLIVFRDDCPVVFDGTYQEFLDKVGWDEEEGGNRKADKQKITKKDIRKLRSDINAEKNKILKPLKEKADFLENEITSAEEEIKTLNDKAVEAAKNGDGKEIAVVSARLAELERLTNDDFDLLDKISGELDEKTAEYAAKLSALSEE